MTADRVIVEADGGSRGNPGPAAYGALVRDAATGRVLADRAECIGVATNNVAEYRGLVAGLELVRQHTPNAAVEVRMDSKLVIEQMKGRWRVKHPSLQPLALAAQRLAPAGTAWRWVPREQNAAVDALLNAALDATRSAGRRTVTPAERSATTAVEPELAEWLDGESADLDGATTLVLVRHGGTDHTLAGRFSGADGDDPPLNEAGRQRAARAATWLRRRAPGTAAVLSSPLRRARETADVLGAALELDVGLQEDLVEASFGAWDGLTLAEVGERWPEELQVWHESSTAAPPLGESYDEVAARVAAALDELRAAHDGRTVVAVSHLTPIRLLTRLALATPMNVLDRLRVPPGSVSALAWSAEGVPAVLGFSCLPP